MLDSNSSQDEGQFCALSLRQMLAGVLLGKCGARCQMGSSLARDRARAFDAFSIAVASPSRVHRAPLIDRPTLALPRSSHSPTLVTFGHIWSDNYARLLDCFHAVNSTLNDSVSVPILVSIDPPQSAAHWCHIAYRDRVSLRVFSYCLVSVLRQCLTPHHPVATLPTRFHDSRRALPRRHPQPPLRVQQWTSPR